MSHVCALKKEQSRLSSTVTNSTSRCQQLKTKIQQCIVVSDENPRSLLHFRSPYMLRKEKERQLSTNPSTIHPCSNFRKWYEMYLIWLYTSLLITKPLEGCFMTPLRYEDVPGFKEYTLFTDCLSLIDMGMNFMTGYFTEQPDNVELRRRVIAKKYMTSCYWVCDMLSSIPKAIFHYQRTMAIKDVVIIVGFVNIACLFKIVRLHSLVVCIRRLEVYVNCENRNRILTLCNVLILVCATHWLACLHFGVSKTIRYYFWIEKKNDSWIHQTGVWNETTTAQYFHAFFKSAAYILGVQISNLFCKKLPEEYIMGILTYIVGKFLVIYAWIYLAVSILNSRSISIKYAELINQLDEYMSQKRLPLNLRKRISDYYHFKYQKKYVKEKSIVGLLSNNLKRDINVHMCSSLVRNVSLFADLSTAEVSKLIDYLVPEIFLPNDTIFSSGTPGNAMYFLSSGTVAVYSRSGKEICHLEDGAYFGELSLIIHSQIRVVSVVAIETCQVYRLNKKEFDICLVNNKIVKEKILNAADQKLKYFKKIEEEDWKILFKNTLQESHQ